jgi:CBS domain-containing protein
VFAAHFAPHFETRLKSALQYSLAHDDALLLQNVKQICNQQIVRVDSQSTIQQAAQKMADRRHTSTLVEDNGRMVGFVSDRNLTKRVIAAGIDINRPICDVMSVDPPTIAEGDMVLQAVSKMIRGNIRNLPVMSGQEVIGVLNVSDLVQKHTAQAVYLIDSIRRQDSVEKLAGLMPQRLLVFDALVDSEIRPQLVSQVMTLIADALTERLIQLAQTNLVESGVGEPPCAYAWMVAGSQARHEMQMVSDQDNAIVLTDEITDSERQYFHQLANFVCHGLAECGYAFCPGEIMAVNQRWCQSVGNWKHCLMLACF